MSIEEIGNLLDRRVAARSVGRPRKTTQNRLSEK